MINDFVKQRYNTPYLRNVINIKISIKITQIYLGLPRFEYKNVLIILLNYMQYKLDFTPHGYLKNLKPTYSIAWLYISNEHLVFII